MRPYRPPTRVGPAPAGASPPSRLLELTGALTAHGPPTIIGPEQAADALLDFLRRRVTWRTALSQTETPAALRSP